MNNTHDTERLFPIFFSILFSLSVNAHFEKDTLKVLFVGNSFTYYYNLPQVVKAMSNESEKVFIDSRHSLVGGSNLSHHLNQEKGSQTIEMLNTQAFDYVVLNHHSLAATDNVHSFFEVSEKIVDLIRSKGAKPLFMMTWSYRDTSQMIEPISRVYNDMAEQLNVDVVPCGLLFERALSSDPHLDLYDDYKHPSNLGTYLNGLAFFKYFTGEKTSDFNKRIKKQDENGQELYLLFLKQRDADLLQNVVDNYYFKTRLN